MSIARAVYADADVYLLDDPLSAVDAHVGKHIFDNVISNDGGRLAGRTRVLVTHGISFLPKMDMIFVMKDGKIAERGTYSELLESKGAFSEFLQQYQSDHKEKDGPDGAAEAAAEEKKVGKTDEGDNNNGKLVEDEGTAMGSLNWSLYKKYFTYVGVPRALFLLSLYIIGQFFRAAANYWLSLMSDESGDSGENVDIPYYLGVFLAFGLGESVVEMYREINTYYAGAAASEKIHASLLQRILRGPMSFFDTNPTGRILNRFSGDIDTLDGNIPNGINDVLWCLFDVLAILVVITSSTPMFVTALVPIGILYVLLQKFYMTTARHVKRLESISKSPIYAHFSESLTGAVSIRAYRQQERFIQASQEKVQTNTTCSYLALACNRWLAVRLEVLGNFIVVFSSLFAILAKDEISSGVTGLTISYSFNIIMSMNWLVITFSELEMSSVALERIIEYMDNPEEAEWQRPDSDSKLPKTWPEKGSVRFDKYQTRYRPELDLVLKGVDMDVKAGEKIGICGRTGAGKSSLTLSLFRIIEPAGGSISIDGVDISELGLHPLRSGLTIIPQDPVLFTGELRFNLDPMGDHSDMELWKALELAHLKDHVTKLPEGLDHEISEGGGNFSMGQRQLLCLARALLRKTKILILDEATASVDLETDDLIQATIRREFADCTVLTIAHRMNTILDSSRIAVFSDGRLAEMGSPQELLEDSSSAFSGLVKRSGRAI